MSLSGQSSESSEREMPTSDGEEEEEENELEEYDDNFGVLTAKPPEGNSNKYSVAAADILEHLDEVVCLCLSVCLSFCLCLSVYPVSVSVPVYLCVHMYIPSSPLCK